MNTLDTIAARRSVRRFKDTPVSDDALQTILTAAVQAPSGSNRQPWRFVVVREDKRAEMVRVMRGGLATRVARGEEMAGAERTAGFMEQASVTVFVFNPVGMHPGQARSPQQTRTDVVDIQSIGAAIQNMLLAAQDMGIGSLWIGHVFNAYEELSEWLGEDGQMIAAVSLGYPDESPGARPRRPVSEVTRYL
ncbi:MAG: nitroreductase family protein [Chloroflexi bacterium]|nr:nitroreductase family protein [Chloroflexota bacterium]